MALERREGKHVGASAKNCKSRFLTASGMTKLKHLALKRAGVLLESCKEFWSVSFSQDANLNMAGFVLYLLGGFALRCSQHPALSKSALSQNENQHQKRFTTEDTESREEGRTLRSRTYKSCKHT